MVKNEQEKGEKRKREEEKEEIEMETVGMRCEGFVSVEAFKLLVKGEIWRVSDDLSWEDFLDKTEDLSVRESEGLGSCACGA